MSDDGYAEDAMPLALAHFEACIDETMHIYVI